EVRHTVCNGAVTQDVERRCSLAICPAAAAEKGECGVDLAGHEQEHEDRSKAASANTPLFQIHHVPAARHQTQRNGYDEDANDDYKCRRQDALDLSEEVAATSAISASRLLSSTKMSAITRDVITTHTTIHASRNGRPNTYGRTRLANGTPPSIPSVGIPRASDTVSSVRCGQKVQRCGDEYAHAVVECALVDVEAFMMVRLHY